jgi:MFS family permease
VSGPAARDALPAAVGAMVCVHACMAGTRVTGSLALLAQGQPAWLVGLLLSMFALGPMLLALWAGQQADRHGMHRMLGLGAALGAVGAGAAAIAPQPGVLLAAALLTGAGVSVASLGVQREAGRMARDAHDLKRVFSWVSFGPALSNMIAPVAAGLLIDHAGARAAFAVAAWLPLLAWHLGRRVPRAPRPPPAARRAGGLLGSLGLLRLAGLRRLLLVNLAMSACWDAHSFVVPVLGHARGLSASSIGVVLGAFAVALLVVRVAISHLADRLDETRALRVALAVAAGVCGLYPWLPGPLGMAAGSFVLGLALGSVQPMVLSRMHQLTPAERQGEALGVRMLTINAATLGVPLAFGLLAGVAGAAAPLWLMAALVLAAQAPARRLGAP